MVSTKDAKEKFDEQISKISRSNPNLKVSFIQKTRQRNPENKLFPNSVKLHTQMKSHLKNILSQQIIEEWSKVTSDSVKLKRFDLDDYTKDDYAFIESGKLAVLDSLVEKINMGEDGTYIESLESMANAKNFSVEIFDNDNELNLIVFSSIKYSTVKHEEDIVSKMADKKLEKIDEDIVIFSNSVDSIYFKNSGLFLIINEKATENMFALDEFYSETSKQVILDLSPSLVDTSKEFLESNLTTKKIQRDIVNMNMNNQFDKTIETYKKYKELFEAHKSQLNPALTQVEITHDNKIRLDTKEKLETFVHMSKHDILQDPLNTVDLYIVYGKRSMRR